MKVLIVTTSFPRWPGDGRGNFIYEAAKAIKRQGWDVRVIAMHNPQAKTHEWNEGIEIIRPKYLPEKWEILQKDNAGLPQTWQTNPLARMAILPFLAIHSLAVIKYAKDVDIIHANWTLSGITVWLTYWLHKKPYIVTVHGSDIFQATKSAMVRCLTKLMLSASQTKAIIAVSNALARRLKEMNVREDKIYVIPDGVDVSFFHPAEECFKRKEILFVGSLTYLKGVDILVRAFAQLCSKFPDYKLAIAGEGPYRKELESLVHNLGLEGKVEFLGLLNRNEVANRMREAKVFILPSRSEGLGVVLLEALASGVPCVGSKTGGIPDVITPDVGSLFQPEDVEGLVNEITQLLSEEQVLREKSENSRRKALICYDWDIIVNKIIDIYNKNLS